MSNTTPIAKNRNQDQRATKSRFTRRSSPQAAVETDPPAVFSLPAAGTVSGTAQYCATCEFVSERFSAEIIRNAERPPGTLRVPGAAVDDSEGRRYMMPPCWS
jgi:hypothetical protein